MELILEVTNPYVAEQSFATSHRFRQAGGTIGRAESCTWRLPDRGRRLSGQHARVEFEQGEYFLRDLSSNGLFVNHASEPLGRERRHRVCDGDRFGMGPYELLARLVRTEHSGADLSSSLASFLAELDAEAGAGQADWGKAHSAVNGVRAGCGDPVERALAQELDELVCALEELELPENVLELPRDELEPLGMAAMSLSGEVERGPDMSGLPHSGGEPVAMDFDGGFGAFGKPASASSKVNGFKSAVPIPEAASVEAAPPHAADCDRLALQAFCRQLGLKWEALNSERSVELMESCARLLRGSLRGLMSLLAVRARQKSRYQLGLTLIEQRRNNPLKHSVNDLLVLHQLLIDPQPENLPMEQALDQAVADLRSHLEAMEAAYQNLVREVVEFVAGGDMAESALARRSWMDRRARKRALRNRLATLSDEDLLRREFFEHRFGKLYQKAIASSPVSGKDRQGRDEP